MIISTECLRTALRENGICDGHQNAFLYIVIITGLIESKDLSDNSVGNNVIGHKEPNWLTLNLQRLEFHSAAVAGFRHNCGSRELCREIMSFLHYRQYHIGSKLMYQPQDI